MKILIPKKRAVRLPGCYSSGKVAALFGDRESMTALEWCDREDVPILDRVWALCHWGILSDGVIRLLACYWAEQTLLSERAAGREPDQRSWDAIIVARQFAHGEATRKDLDAASDAAWAAGAAARAAAGAAASDAAGATGAAAWDWQLECFKTQIKFEENRDEQV